jgi:hypothetical protein
MIDMKLPHCIFVSVLAVHGVVACADPMETPPPPTGLRSFHLAEWRNTDQKKTLEIALTEKTGGWAEGGCRRYVVDPRSGENQEKHVINWACEASVFERIVGYMFLGRAFDSETPEPNDPGKTAEDSFTYQFQQVMGGKTNSWTRTTRSNLEELSRGFLTGMTEKLPIRVARLTEAVPSVGFYESLSGADAVVWKEFSEYYASGELAWHYAVEFLSQTTNSAAASSSGKEALSTPPSVVDDFTGKWFHRFPDHPETSIELIEEHFLSRRVTKMWLSCADYAEGVTVEVETDSEGNPIPSMPTITCRWMFSRDEWQNLIERCFDDQRSIDYWPSTDELGFYQGESCGKMTVVAKKGDVKRQFMLPADRGKYGGWQKLPNVLYEILRLVPYRLHPGMKGEAWNVKAATGTLARHLISKCQYVIINDLYVSPRFYETFKSHDAK